MKKFILALLGYIAVIALGVAQNNLANVSSYVSVDDVWIEDDDLCYFIEAGGGIVMGGMKYPQTYGNNKIGYNGFLEGRYRLKNRHFDLGLYLGYGEFKRKNIKGKSKTFDSFDVMLTGNYNLYAWKKATVFMGVGVGVTNESAIDVIAGVVDSIIRPDDPNDPYDSYFERDDNKRKTTLGIMLRGGMQVGRTIRVTGGYKFLGEQTSHAFITVGVNLGLGSR